MLYYDPEQPRCRVPDCDDNLFSDALRMDRDVEDCIDREAGAIELKLTTEFVFTYESRH